MSNIAGLRINGNNGEITGLLELVQCVNGYQTPGERIALRRAELAEANLVMAIALVERLYEETAVLTHQQIKLSTRHAHLTAAARSYLADACNTTRGHLSFLLAKES